MDLLQCAGVNFGMCIPGISNIIKCWLDHGIVVYNSTDLTCFWQFIKLQYRDHSVSESLCLHVSSMDVVLQSSRWGRESWLICLICLPVVSWWLSGSSSRCHEVVCGLWLCYFLIIFIYYLLKCICNFVTQFLIQSESEWSIVYIEGSQVILSYVYYDFLWKSIWP